MSGGTAKVWESPVRRMGAFIQYLPLVAAEQRDFYEQRRFWELWSFRRADLCPFSWLRHQGHTITTP